MTLKDLKSAAGTLTSLAGAASSTSATPLAPMPFWQARSFWLTLITVLLGAFPGAGNDLLGLLGFADANQLVDVIMKLLPIVTAVWAWLERRAPKRQLVLSTGRTGS